MRNADDALPAARLAYAAAKRLWLKNHPHFNEAWLQDRIAEDPAMLGLGEVDVLSRERRQPAGGRLDLLLFDAEQNTRFEVELMLGATDESHIIRTIEYWDVERRRYPGYEHVPVLVAEDITTRFLNVLGLFAGTIPLVAVQLSALEVEGRIVLDFVKVLDRQPLRVDDVTESQEKAVGRDYWVQKKSAAVTKLADRVFELLNEEAGGGFKPLYLHSYVALGRTDDTTRRNFVTVNPKAHGIRLRAEVPEQEAWAARLEEAGLDPSTDKRYVKVMLRENDLKQHEGLIRELLKTAWQAFGGE